MPTCGSVERSESHIIKKKNTEANVKAKGPKQDSHQHRLNSPRPEGGEL
jgi:hypothetical protein